MYASVRAHTHGRCCPNCDYSTASRKRGPSGAAGEGGYPKPFIVAFSGRQLAPTRAGCPRAWQRRPRWWSSPAGTARSGRMARLWFSRASIGTAARSKCPGSQPPTRPPTTPEAQPLAQGCPLALKGAPQPLGCQREPALTLWCLPKVADVTAFDHPGTALRRSRAPCTGSTRSPSPSSWTCCARTSSTPCACRSTSTSS